MTGSIPSEPSELVGATAANRRIGAPTPSYTHAHSNLAAEAKLAAASGGAGVGAGAALGGIPGLELRREDRVRLRQGDASGKESLVAFAVDRSGTYVNSKSERTLWTSVALRKVRERTRSEWARDSAARGAASPSGRSKANGDLRAGLSNGNSG